MTEPRWWSEEYSPVWAAHVVGKIASRVVDEDGMPEPQRVDVECSKCGRIWKGSCTSGATRNMVSRFAAIHVPCARDPLAVGVSPQKSEV